MIKFLFLIFILSYISCGTGCNNCPGANCFATNCSANCSSERNNINVCPCNFDLTRTRGSTYDWEYDCTTRINKLPDCYVDNYCSYVDQNLFGFEFNINGCGPPYTCPEGSTQSVSGNTQACLWKINPPLPFLLIKGDCKSSYYYGYFGYSFETDHYFHEFRANELCNRPCCCKAGCNPCNQSSNQCEGGVCGT